LATLNSIDDESIEEPTQSTEPGSFDVSANPNDDLPYSPQAKSSERGAQRDNTRPASKPRSETTRPSDNRPDTAKPDEKEPANQEGIKTKGREGEKDEKAPKKPSLGKDNPLKQLNKNPAAVAKKLGSQIASFASKNRKEIGIGSGILAIITTAFVLILSFAPLKVVNMMENLYDYNWRRNNSAFETRRNKIVKQFLRQKAGIVDASGTPIADGVSESDRSFWDKTFKRLAGDNKFIRQLRESGYSVDFDANNSNRLIIRSAPSVNLETGKLEYNEIKDYDLLTEKGAARKEINAIVDEATKGEGWFKRIFEKRRYQIKTGTKWHWLDPINQPINKLKKKVTSEVLEFLLKNEYTTQFTQRIIASLLDIEIEKVDQTLAKEVTQKTSDKMAAEVANEATDRIANKAMEEISQKVTKDAVEEVVSKVVSTIFSDANPIGAVLLVVGVYCTTNNFLDQGSLPKAIEGFAELQYMTTFTKWESISSQVKYGNADKKLGDNELNANLDLLSSEDGKTDVGASNNYKRATGEQIAYNPNDEQSNDCNSGTELCVERQPRCALFSTGWGKAYIILAQSFAANGKNANYDYCKAALNNSKSAIESAQNWALEMANVVYPLMSKIGYVIPAFDGRSIDALCTVWSAATKAVNWVVGGLFGFIKKVIPPVGYLADLVTDKLGDLVSWFMKNILAPTLVQVISDQIRGPQLANAIAAGADFSANNSLKELNAKPLSKAEATAYEKQYYAQLREKHNNASLADKAFSLKDRYSLASQVLYKIPASPKVAVVSTYVGVCNLFNPSLFMDNINNGFKSVLAMFSGKALADEPYRNPFGLKTIDEGKCDGENISCVYGFTQEQLDAPLGSDEMKKLDHEIGCSLITTSSPDDNDKPEECVLAENASSGGGVSKTTTPPDNTLTAGIIGDIGLNSDSVPCPIGTKDLGVANTRYTGSFKKESGVLKIRLCQISEISGEGNDVNGNRISGGAVVNSRVAQAWLGLAQAAKAAGISLVSNSSFRLADSCGGGGDGSLCATPGSSPHQLGIAIDFNGMDVTGTSTTSCNGRAKDPSNPAWNWLYNNAEKWGIKQYTKEAWHWDLLNTASRCSSLN